MKWFAMWFGLPGNRSWAGWFYGYKGQALQHSAHLMMAGAHGGHTDYYIAEKIGSKWYPIDSTMKW